MPARLAAFVLSTVLVTSGCAGRQAPRQRDGYQTVLAATDLDGRPVRRPGQQTSASVVVFFASWCGPCRHELSILGEMRKADPTLHIVGVSAYEDWSDRSSEEQLRTFLGNAAPWLQVIRGNQAILGRFGGVPKIPSMFVFDRQGVLVESFDRAHRPPPDRRAIEAAVTRARARAQR